MVQDTPKRAFLVFLLRSKELKAFLYQCCVLRLTINSNKELCSSIAPFSLTKDFRTVKNVTSYNTLVIIDMDD